MISISFTTPADGVFTVQAKPGQSLMSISLANGIPGILGDCGGSAACGTCHIRVSETAWGLVGAPTPGEDALLSSLTNRHPRSRLACQVTVDESMQGLHVEVAEQEY